MTSKIQQLENYPFTFKSLTDEQLEKIKKMYRKKYHIAAICVENNYFLPPAFVTLAAKQVYNMKIRPDDIWVVTMPKCGTTMTQELTWQIMNGFDLKKGEIHIKERSPFLDFLAIAPDHCRPNHMEWIDNFPSPRIIKTHYPFEFLPPNLLNSGAKIIYVGRNPKDACVSYFYHEKLFDSESLIESFDFYAKLYKEDLIEFGPYWQHLNQGINQPKSENYKFMWYEEMIKDMRATIRDLSKFLGVSLSEGQVNSIADHMKVDNLRDNKSVNIFRDGDKSFIRKGITGDYKNHFSAEANSEWDEWINENCQKYNIKLSNEYLQS